MTFAKRFLLLITLLFSFNCLGVMEYGGYNMPFISHTKDKPFGSYLTLNLPFGPMKQIYEDLKMKTKLPLKSRGEAHITVITPPEFDRVLKGVVSMEEINAIAKADGIQDISFSMLCLGKGEAVIKGEKAHTYFIVVESPKLIKMREKIFNLYRKKGGKSDKFQPNHFFPHITIGFTPRDLHESDGVVKDKKSCISEVPLVF